MRSWFVILRCCALLLLILPAACADQTRQLAVLGGAARTMNADDGDSGDMSFSAQIQPAVPEGRMQCVPFARQVSGVDLRGNAGTWWRSAEGKYLRGNTPREMAVMVLKPSGSMRLGHVAVVTKVLNAREVLVSHANWGWDRASRSRVRHGQKAVDVSANNDWSQIRFYNSEFGSLGRPYPAYGYIYGPQAQKEHGLQIAEAEAIDVPMHPDAAPVPAVHQVALIDAPDESDDADEVEADPEADAPDGDGSGEISLADAEAIGTLSYPPPPEKPLLALVSSDKYIDPIGRPPLPPPSPRRSSGRRPSSENKDGRGDHVPLPPRHDYDSPAVLERRRVIP